MKLLFAGYATADIIEGSFYPGGAAAIMALNSILLDVKPSLISVLSSDQYGIQFKELFNNYSIDTSLCIAAPHQPTCIITDPFTLGSKREWSDNGANAYFEKMELRKHDFESFDGIILANSNPFLAKKIGLITPKQNLFYIPGPQVVTKPDYIQIQALQKSRVVFCNEEEAPFVFKQRPFDLGVEIVVETRGKDGGVIHTQSNNISYTAPHIEKVVDPTGAGDNFALGFIVSFLKKNNIKDAVDAGKDLSSRVISQKGGVLVNALI